jgi:hypothetical protein
VVNQSNKWSTDFIVFVCNLNSVFCLGYILEVELAFSVAFDFITSIFHDYLLDFTIEHYGVFGGQ